MCFTKFDVSKKDKIYIKKAAACSFGFVIPTLIITRQKPPSLQPFKP